MKTIKNALLALLKRLFSLSLGSAKTGALLVLEIAQALLMKIAWQVVLERFLTRVLVGSLHWLKDLSSNRIVQETVDDILLSLKEKGLKEATNA